MNTQSEVLSILKELIDIDSPIGFTKKIEHYICSYLYEFGYSPEVRKGGGIYCTINESSEKHILLTAHMDSLGAMVKNVSKNGHLDISPLGGLNANNIEGENCRIYTRCGKTLTGVIQLKNPSIHVNNSYDDTKRTFDTIEVVIDSDVKSENDVSDLGIDVGDFIAIEPRFTITDSGYIKSRFLDDKAGTAILMMVAKWIKGQAINKKVSLFFSANEEMGYGGAALSDISIDELIAVDMGCIGEGLKCNEKQVSICAKDSGGPYNYDLVSELVKKAKDAKVDYVIDIYPFYKSDAEVALRAGVIAKHALVGMGVYASHGYERTHINGIINTLFLLEHYLLD